MCFVFLKGFLIMSNKIYDVYGIGNALLDFEYRVHDEVLSALNIEKSVMTLVDFKRHQQLLEHLGGINHILACGGSSANSLAIASMLGSKSFFSCRVASDSSGLHYYNSLVEAGIETNIKLDDNISGATGKCIVLITPDADRSMNTYLGVAEQVSVADLCEDRLAQSKYLYIEGYLATSTTGCEMAIEAKRMAEQHGVKTALSLSDPNVASYFREQFKQIIGDGVDLLFCNEREALLFCDTEDLSQAHKILQSIAKNYVITLGKKGAQVYDGREVKSVAAVPVDVIDTLGAGDAFAGAYLHAVTHGSSVAQAANVASYVSAKTVAKYGPRLEPEDIELIKADLDYIRVV